MDLLPCPFCGSDSVSPSYCMNVDNVVSGRFVECEDCAACGPVHPPEAVAITAWNTRTPSEAVLVEALRQQVRDLDNLTKEYRSVFDVQSPESEILRLQNALRDIAFLRPGGPTRNKLAMQMERIAIDALDALAAAKGERV